MNRLEKATDVKIHKGPYALFVKRGLDILFSIFGIVFFLPIWLIVALLVRIKLGKPIFFTQIRIGKDEKPFRMIKFRSMADLRDEKGKLLPDTKRFTKFGDFLRKTSIDEIPELINVLLGQMSLVGPRPLYTFYLPYYNDEEALRHFVRGGITGLAQINGRNIIGWEERLHYDIQYVKNITFINDLKIIFGTIIKVVKKEDVGIPSVDEPEGLHIEREIQRPEIMQEIGSSFSVSRDKIGKDKNVPKFIKTEGYEIEKWYSTGRSCIREILKSIKDEHKVALVPPFTCESVTNPFFESGYRVHTYPIHKDLNIDYVKLIKLLIVIKPSIFIFHSYFGFDTCKNLQNIVEQTVDWKMWTINDETQSMFIKGINDWTDFRIGSVRKWGPIPDGAYLLAKEGKFADAQSEDREFVDGELNALTMKQDYLIGKNIPKQLFLAKFAAGRKYADNQKGTYSMSAESRYIANRTNWDDVSEIRRQNYGALLSGLRNIGWIDIPNANITKNCVPYQMAIYVKKGRKEFQSFLADNRVYATIIWGCPKELKSIISDKEIEIYDMILCLPCDQRYSENDMKRIVSLFKEYEKGNVV